MTIANCQQTKPSPADWWLQTPPTYRLEFSGILETEEKFLSQSRPGQTSIV